MGLASDQFANVDPNFAAVTFNVTDGSLTVVCVDAVITTAPVAADPIYDGSDQELIVPGEADGGIFCYAVNHDPQNAPSDSSFAPSIPTANETGSYYVWYKVISDANHNDLPAFSVRVILSEKDWVELSGSLYGSDGVTAIGDAVVTLMKGNRKVDYAVTSSDGNYRFIVPAGVYNVVAEYQQNTQTSMAALFSDKTQDTVMSGGKTESQLRVVSFGDSTFVVAVDGLNEEASHIRKADNIPEDKSVSVLMTVEPKTETNSLNARTISLFAKNKSLVFFDAKVEKTVDSTKTVLDETENVLEIAVPYEKVGKRGLAVYSSDSSDVRTLKESTNKEDGTFSVDKENNVINIYSNRFSTFAIGYTPYYQVQSSASLGSFEGTVTVSVASEDGSEVFKLENVDPDKISFADIPKGEYTVTVTWTEGVENTLTFPLTVGDKKSVSQEQTDAGSVKASYQDGAVVTAAFDGIGESGASASPLMMTAGHDSTVSIVSDAFGAYALTGSPELRSGISQSDPDKFFLATGKSKRGYLRI